MGHNDGLSSWLRALKRQAADAQEDTRRRTLPRVIFSSANYGFRASLPGIVNSQALVLFCPLLQVLSFLPGRLVRRDISVSALEDFSSR